jgi:hypothetical protein
LPTVIAYSTKLRTEQVDALRKASKETRIPQTVLVRQAVDLLLGELNNHSSSSDFLTLVQTRVAEEHQLLKRLASS